MLTARLCLRLWYRTAAIAITAAGGLVGCASTPGSTVVRDQPAMRTLAVDQNGTAIQTNGSTADRVKFTVAADELFSVTLGAFADVGLEATVVDARTRHIANPSFIRSRTLGTTPLSRYFECGTNITGVKADNERITITVDVSIDPSGPTGSSMRILVAATAKSMTGSSTGAVDCGSTGRLEQSLRNAIGLRLAKK